MEMKAELDFKLWEVARATSAAPAFLPRKCPACVLPGRVDQSRAEKFLVLPNQLLVLGTPTDTAVLNC